MIRLCTHAHLAIAALCCLLMAGCERHDVQATKTPEPESSDLQLSPELMKTGQVRVEAVTSAIERLAVRTSGKAGFNEERLSYVSSPLVGRVVDSQVRPGDHVEVGQVLAVIDSPELGAASSDYIKARADLLLAERSYKLAQDLAAAKALARKEFQKAEDEYVKAKADVRQGRERLQSLGLAAAELDAPLDQLHVQSRLNLTAPVSGTVVDRNLTLGQMVGGDPGQRLYVIADLTDLWVSADIYEKDLHLVHPGDAVTVEAPAWPGETFTGHINYIGDTVDATSRTVKVRLDVDNRAQRLKPEMFVTATIHTEGTTTVLSVPLGAVHGEGIGEPYVFVALADRRFAPRRVTLGNKFDGRTVVTAGLAPGDQVVTEGSILLKAAAAQRSDG